MGERSLPEFMGLDWSIQAHGLDIAWRLFWDRLRLFGCNRSSLSEVTYWRVRAMFLNGDRRGYLTALVDAGVITYKNAIRFAAVRTEFEAGDQEPAKQSAIFKWVPGDHYYCLGRKFDTYAEAEAHLQANGVRSLGLRERHVYRPE